MAQNYRRCLVIPAAGSGKRFEERGYINPKPFIDIEGRPMIEMVIRNLRKNLGHCKTIIILREDMHEYAKTIQLDDVEVVFGGDPSGTAGTLMRHLPSLNKNAEIIIANSDQIVKFDSTQFELASKGSGTILTFECSQLETKWSYAQLNVNNDVSYVAEKNPISTHATVGVYRFANIKMLIDGIKKMIAANDRTNGEFYLCPVYNHIIQKKGPIKTVQVEKLWPMGIPEDLISSMEDFSFREYLRLLID